MKRDRNLPWVLAVLAMSACEAAPNDGTTCVALCSTPGTVLTGDGGTGGSDLPEAGGGGALDAGATLAPFDAGNSAPLDGSLAPRDSGNRTDADSLISLADASGADANSAVDSGGTGTVSTGTGSVLAPVTDYAKPGSFKTTMQANVGPGNNYTVFRPDPLGADGFMHSPIIFGPGIFTDAGMYSALLTHLASHGFVAVSVNSMGGGPGDPNNLSDMKMGLDWIIAQNAQAGVYQGKLAVTRAIAMGYSIGATASVELASHPAIMTTVAIHGHGTEGNPHGPALLLTGTSDVIDQVKMTMSTMDEAPALLVALPIGHLDVLDELAMLTTITPTARYIAPITAWLRYWAHGDQAAKSFFSGSDCGMCKTPWITPESNAKWKALML